MAKVFETSLSVIKWFGEKDLAQAIVKNVDSELKVGLIMQPVPIPTEPQEGVRALCSKHYTMTLLQAISFWSTPQLNIA